jgi:hypothetical protein
LVIDAKSWSDILQVQCDLSASDHELSSSFLSFVRRLRRERKIKSPSGPKGKRNRPVSWRWPELLDIKHYMPVEKLDDAERSKLSKAQKLAKTLNEYVNSRLQPDSDEDFTPVRLGDLRKTLIV